jgi:hypothetical protein
MGDITRIENGVNGLAVVMRALRNLSDAMDRRRLVVGHRQPSSVRFGRASNSPPQFGQVSLIAAAQSGQKVHSKLQMRASPAFGVGA